MEPDPSTQRWALITPSYAPDFERCALLVESAERCLLGDWRHYLFVDRADYPLFQRLHTARTRVLVSESLMPSWVHRVGDKEPRGATAENTGVVGWVWQQLIKMSAFDAIPEDVAVFCDSDVALLRPVDLKARLTRNGRLALWRFTIINDDVRAWTRLAQELLGLAASDRPGIGYVNNLVVWRRSVLQAVRRRIEEVTGLPWIQAMAPHGNISEYTLYGAYAEHVLGLEAAGHFPFVEPLVLGSWDLPLRAAADVDAFLARLRPEHVGVMVHSKHGAPVSLYADRVRAFWR